MSFTFEKYPRFLREAFRPLTPSNPNPDPVRKLREYQWGACARGQG